MASTDHNEVMHEEDGEILYLFDMINFNKCCFCIKGVSMTYSSLILSQDDVGFHLEFV